MAAYIGISWTRPVPWAQFTTLSEDIDEAARQSRTIRYQRDLIRRWVRAQKGDLIREIVFIELAPDRASHEAVAELSCVAAKAPEGTVFLHVDFSADGGWRRHNELGALLSSYETVVLSPDPLPIDIDPDDPAKGKATFDPARHFVAWERTEARHIAAKDDHAATILSVLKDFSAASWPARAAALNAAGLHTHGGKPWSGDNLRKFCALHRP